MYCHCPEFDVSTNKNNLRFYPNDLPSGHVLLCFPLALVVYLFFAASASVTDVNKDQGTNPPTGTRNKGSGSSADRENERESSVLGNESVTAIPDLLKHSSGGAQINTAVPVDAPPSLIINHSSSSSNNTNNTSNANGEVMNSCSTSNNNHSTSNIDQINGVPARSIREIPARGNLASNVHEIGRCRCTTATTHSPFLIVEPHLLRDVSKGEAIGHGSFGVWEEKRGREGGGGEEG